MAVATDLALGTVLLAGDLAGSSNANTPQLTPTGVTPGEYKGASVIIDAKGRILHARNMAYYDVGCATDTECGVVSVTSNHFITKNGDEISIKKASTTEYGVVKIGDGFSKDCCEIFVDYVEATPTTLGVVTVPTAGNLLVDGAGNISVPVGTTTTNGIVRVVDGNGLALVDGEVSYTPPTATASIKGFVEIGSGFAIAAGQLSIPLASPSTAGAFRFNSDFGFAANTYSYTTVATGGAVGYVKIGTGLGVDVDGTISRGQGSASPTQKGAVQITAGNGLSVSSGVISYAPATATTSVLGVMRAGTNVNISSGVISLPEANGTATKGIMAVANTGKLEVTNGLISFGPAVMLKDRQNVFTKAQNVTKVSVTSSSTVNLDLTAGNVFDLTMLSNITFSNPGTLISGGQYILILRQDATGGRIPTFSSNWYFTDTYGGALDGLITTTPNAVNVVTFMVVGTQIIAQIERDFS